MVLSAAASLLCTKPPYPVAPLLSDQLIGVAKAHAEHRLNLVAECRHDRVVRTATCQPRLALRRCCLLALVASTHGAVRVLEQAVSAAVGAVALRVGVRGMWTRTRVFLGYTWTFAGIPGFYLQVAHALVFEYIIHIHEYRKT